MRTVIAAMYVAFSGAFHSALFVQPAIAADEEKPMARVTGIGGVFILSRGNGKELAAQYEKHLGMKPEDFGAVVLQWE